MKSTELVLAVAALLLAVVVLGKVFGQAGGKAMAAGTEVAIEEIRKSDRR